MSLNNNLRLDGAFVMAFSQNGSYTAGIPDKK